MKSASEPTPSLEAPGLPGEPALDSANLPPAYWRAFGVVAFTMNRFLIDHMIRAARHFDNDTESMILFGMLAHLNVAHMVPPGTRPSEALDAQGRVPEAQPQMRPIRLRDLSQIAGRPRETVRRKLDRLERQGRVLRLDGGYVIDARSVDEGMRALSVDGAQRFLETAREIEGALRDAEQALGAHGDKRASHRTSRASPRGR